MRRPAQMDARHRDRSRRVFVYIGDYPGGVWNLSAKFSVGEPLPAWIAS